MIVQSFRGKTPRVADSALVADTVYLLGDVEIGENTTIFPGVVIRSDTTPIRIGNNCCIEDNCVLHTGTWIGDNVMVGHCCLIEAKVGSNTLIGSTASVLATAEVGEYCVIAAGSVVLEQVKIPDYSFVTGIPGIVRATLSPSEVTGRSMKSASLYLKHIAALADEYREQGIWKR